MVLVLQYTIRMYVVDALMRTLWAVVCLDFREVLPVFGFSINFTPDLSSRCGNIIENTKATGEYQRQRPTCGDLRPSGGARIFVSLCYERLQVLSPPFLSQHRLLRFVPLGGQ